MKSRLWLNIAMACFLVVLIIIAIYQPGQEQEPGLPQLTQLKKTGITHILLSRHDDTRIELSKHDGQWWMQHPYRLPANDFRVQSLLRLAEAESHSQHDLTELIPATFGLDTPRAIATFNKSVSVRFGKTEPLHRRRYVEVNNILNTIDDTYYYQVASNINAYLSHALLPSDVKINRLRLPTLELALKDGKWQRTPALAEISADADIELLNAWRESQALELRTGGDTKLKANIEIYLAEANEPLRYHLLRQDEEVLLVRLDNGMQYVVGEDIAEKLTTLIKPEAEPESLTPVQAVPLPDVKQP